MARRIKSPQERIIENLKKIKKDLQSLNIEINKNGADIAIHEDGTIRVYSILDHWTVREMSDGSIKVNKEDWL